MTTHYCRLQLQTQTEHKRSFAFGKASSHPSLDQIGGVNVKRVPRQVVEALAGAWNGMRDLHSSQNSDLDYSRCRRKTKTERGLPKDFRDNGA